MAILAPQVLMLRCVEYAAAIIFRCTSGRRTGQTGHRRYRLIKDAPS